jgi:hypothetical protein
MSYTSPCMPDDHSLPPCIYPHLSSNTPNTTTPPIPTHPRPGNSPTLPRFVASKYLRKSSPFYRPAHVIGLAKNEGASPEHTHHSSRPLNPDLSSQISIKQHLVHACHTFCLPAALSMLTLIALLFLASSPNYHHVPPQLL